VEKGLSSAQFVVGTVVSAKECLEFAQFAQYEAVLIDSDSLIFADALALVKAAAPGKFRRFTFRFRTLP
jgi:hypothetical protein